MHVKWVVIGLSVRSVCFFAEVQRHVEEVDCFRAIGVGLSVVIVVKESSYHLNLVDYKALIKCKNM